MAKTIGKMIPYHLCKVWLLLNLLVILFVVFVRKDNIKFWPKTRISLAQMTSKNLLPILKSFWSISYSRLGLWYQASCLKNDVV